MAWNSNERAKFPSPGSMKVKERRSGAVIQLSMSNKYSKVDKS